ncbi:MAG TPA: VOC family protein [Candidatus Kapabacteria bacterium]|nr:VOC family protein [Candidatus Kapabacteria bacterium]
MAQSVNPIPEGYLGITPYITVRDAANAIEFYKNAFGATETMRIMQPDGRVGHAELTIGTAPIMLSDEFPEHGITGPQTLGGTPVTMHLYVEDVDAFAERAVAAGATLLRPVANQFYGDRGGKLQDPYGHAWWVATHVEDVSPEEMQRRAGEANG